MESPYYNDESASKSSSCSGEDSSNESFLDVDTGQHVNQEKFDASEADAPHLHEMSEHYNAVSLDPSYAENTLGDVTPQFEMDPNDGVLMAVDDVLENDVGFDVSSGDYDDVHDMADNDIDYCAISDDYDADDAYDEAGISDDYEDEWEDGEE